MAKTNKKNDAPDASKLKVGDTIPCGLLMRGITSEPVVLVVTNTLNDEDGHSVDFDLTFFGQVIGRARAWVDEGGLSWDEDVTNSDPDDEIPLLDTGEQIVAYAEAKAGWGALYPDDEVVESIEVEQVMTGSEAISSTHSVSLDESGYMPGSVDQIIEKEQDDLKRHRDEIGKFWRYSYTSLNTNQRMNVDGQTRKQFIEAELEVDKALADIKSGKETITMVVNDKGGHISSSQGQRVEDAYDAREVKRAKRRQKYKAKEGKS